MNVSALKAQGLAWVSGWAESRLPAWSRQFESRTRRERWVLLVGAVALVWALADTLWLGQAWQRRQRLNAQSQEHSLQRQLAETELAALQREIQLVEQEQLRNLSQARTRAAQAQQALLNADTGLVSAQQMLPLLDELLGRRCSAEGGCPSGLRVRSVRTLAPVELSGATEPLTARADAAASVAAVANGGTAGPQRPGVWKHGVEIVLEGGFVELASYVERLEAMPQRWLPGGMQYRVEKYPRASLTLRLFTLSLDSGWLELS